jgi:hypothetical protein
MGLSFNSDLRSDLLSVIRDKNLSSNELQQLKVQYLERAKTESPESNTIKVEKEFYEKLSLYVGKSVVDKLKTGTSDSVVTLDIEDLGDGVIAIDNDNNLENGVMNVIWSGEDNSYSALNKIENPAINIPENLLVENNLDQNFVTFNGNKIKDIIAKELSAGQIDNSKAPKLSGTASSEVQLLQNYLGFPPEKQNGLLNKETLTSLRGKFIESLGNGDLKKLIPLKNILDSINGSVNIINPKLLEIGQKLISKNESSHRSFLGSSDRLVNITFKNNNPDFQVLVEKAKHLKIDQSGEIDYEKYGELKKFAGKSGGTLTKDEEQFLSVIKIKGNLETLITSDSSNFTLKAYDVNFTDISKKAWEEDRDFYTGKLDDTNPLKSEINDVGRNSFYSTLFEQKSETELNQKSAELKLKLDGSIKDKELKESVNNFLGKLNSFPDINKEKFQKNNLEALIFIDRMVNERQPHLEEYQVKALLVKLNTMLDADYSQYSGRSKELVLSALHDIAVPENISQKKISSCGATCVQIQLALRAPEEYLEMLDTLAREQDYKSKGGALIKPNMSFYGDTTDRSISSKIMQNAIMDFSNGSKLGYDSKNDPGGLMPGQLNEAIRNILGNNNYVYKNGDYTPGQLITVLKNSSPSRQEPINIGMAFSESGRDAYHFVNVIGIKDNKVTIINPWGREETFSTEQLQKNIFSISAPPGRAANMERVANKSIDDIFAKNKWYESTDEISNHINKNGNAFLDKLDLSQKAKIVKFLVNGSTTQDDKKAIQKILNQMTSGSDGQSQMTVISFQEELKKNGLTLYDVLKEVKSDSPEFYKFATKFIVPDPNHIDFNIGKLVATGSKTSNDFLKTATPNEVAIVTLAVSDKGDSMADNPEVAAKMIKSLYEVAHNYKTDDYFKKRANQALKDFQKGINDDWDTGKITNELNKINKKLVSEIESYTGLRFEND